jgi:hypothetical protein
VDGVPAFGGEVVTTAESREAATATETDGGADLDNGLLRVVVDARGLVTSLFDRTANREVIAPGVAGNLVQLHPDLPNRWDAWDVDAFYRNTATDLVTAEAVEVVRPGELAEGAAAVRVVRTFRVEDHAAAHAAPGRPPTRDRHGGRLARAGDLPQARLPARRRGRRVVVRDPVRARQAPAHTNTS